MTLKETPRHSETADRQLAGLLTQIASGKEPSLTTLYQLMEKPVYRFAMSRLRDPHAAAEVLTETMLDIWRNADRFEGRSKVSTWIFGIARFKVLDVLRAREKHQYEELDSEMVDDDAPTTLDWVAGLEDHKALHHCLDGLPDTHREVIHFTFFQDMHYDEIAEIMQCPSGTIKSRMFHARQLLKRCLESVCLNMLQKN